jgi:DNA polymerase (family 10)
MGSPHVDCIGHLTGRKIGRRPAYSVDVERVIERALETGTALEINSQPDRLDMPDEVARLCGEAGVRIALSSDAHRVAALAYLEIGIGQARRAWLTKKHVLNTRPWPEIAKGLAR